MHKFVKLRYVYTHLHILVIHVHFLVYIIIYAHNAQYELNLLLNYLQKMPGSNLGWEICPTVWSVVVFLSPAKRMPLQCLTLDCDRYLSHPLKFTLHGLRVTESIVK